MRSLPHREHLPGCFYVPAQALGLARTFLSPFSFHTSPRFLSTPVDAGLRLRERPIHLQGFFPPSGTILAKFSGSFHSFLRGRAEGRRKSKAGCRRKEIFPQAWVRDLREAYSEASKLHPAVGWKPERPRLRPAPLGSGGQGTKVRALVLAGHGFGSRLRRGRTLWTSSLTPSPPPQE